MAKLRIIYIKNQSLNIQIHKIALISLLILHYALCTLNTKKIFTSIKTSKYCTDENSQDIERKKELFNAKIINLTTIIFQGSKITAFRHL